MFRYLAIAFFLSLFCLPLRAADSGLSETERLQAFEKAVQQLQQRNAELEREVHQLKAKSSPFASIISEPEAKHKISSDGKICRLFRANAFHLEGKKCPFCKRGVFHDSGHRAIS